MNRADILKQLNRTKDYYTRALQRHVVAVSFPLSPDDPIVRTASSEALLCRVVAIQFGLMRDTLELQCERDEALAIAHLADEASAAALAYVRALT